MAQSLKLDVKDARDSASVFLPDVKSGNILAADYVLKHLGINTATNWSGSYATGNPIWGKAGVSGMGARDAIFMMESRGIKTRIYGRGKVVKQSLVPGTRIKKGQVCALTLDL